MSEVSCPPREGYQPPDPIEVPPLYAWPPRPAAALRWLAGNLLFPWGLFFIALAVVAWKYLTPSLETMATLDPGWIYFTVFMLWWVVPVHPVIVILTGFYQGISPSISHSGFDQLLLKGGRRVTAGDQFHHLHHRYFHVNFGNTPMPVDKLFGSWHDGTPASHAAFRDMLRNRGKPRQGNPATPV